MSLKLVMTERFDAKTIRAELSEHLEVGEPEFIALNAADPPSILQALGDSLSWLPLKAAVAVFLSTLAKRAADATWDRLTSLFESNEVRPLLAVVKTLRKAANSVDGKVAIFVGLDIPDDRFGTAMPIKLDDPEEKTTRELASFVAHVDQLSKTMQAEVEAGRAPLGRAIIEPQDDGSLLVRWEARADDSRHELRIPAS